MVNGDQLADRSAGVIAHERHVLELKMGHEVRDDLREPKWREVGARVQRQLLGAERPVWCDHAEIGRQPRRDLAPQLAVGEEPVHEQDRFARAELAVADRALGQAYLIHRAVLPVRRLNRRAARSRA